ncbi:MAG: Uma2 family endonuclease [Cyanobacteria bacterium P01_D01_bin.105]
MGIASQTPFKAQLAKWTLAEYHHMIDAGILDERRVELIKGEIVEMAPEGEPHAYSISESGEYLTTLLGKQAKVRNGHPITLPDDSEPEPDIAIVQRLGKEYLEHHPYPENIFWIIEYSDATLKKDLNIKSQMYATANIPEYWVVDLKRKVLVVFRELSNGHYTSRTEYTQGKITPLTFPHIPILVSAIIEQE